jgi:hypothetical protein
MAYPLIGLCRLHGNGNQYESVLPGFNEFPLLNRMITDDPKEPWMSGALKASTSQADCDTEDFKI